MLLHCADTANPTRPEAIYRQWTGRVMEEFYQQGDLEKANGLPVSRFYCRQTTNVPKCQIGFINIIVCHLTIATPPTPCTTRHPLTHYTPSCHYAPSPSEPTTAHPRSLPSLTHYAGKPTHRGLR